jgi:hypothetical protein
MHSEKVICQKHLQVSNIEEDKLQFGALFCLKLFCKQIFRIGQQFPNQRNILRCIDTHQGAVILAFFTFFGITTQP